MKQLTQGFKSLRDLFKKEQKFVKITPEKLARKIRTIKLFHPFHKVVVVNGCFDLLHAGHSSMLANAKRFGDGPNILIVGINSDTSIRELKGLSRPILSEEARLFSIQQQKSVDYAFVFDSTDFSSYLGKCGQCVFIKGEDYKEITTEELAELEKNGGYWSTVGSAFNITTTEICKKIKETNLT